MASSASPGSAREIPFQPGRCFARPDDVEHALRLAPLRKKAASMRVALLANLVYAEAVGRKGIHYSRDRSAYSDLDYKHYAPHWATNRAMLAAVASLLAESLVIETRARPGSARRLRRRRYGP